MKPNEIKTSPSLQRLLLRLASQARASSTAHYATAASMTKRHYLFGVPIIVLCAFAGTTLFSSIGAETPVWVFIVLGIACLIASVLASLLTFFQFSETAGRHRFAASNYAVIRRELELLQLEYSDIGAINEPQVLERLTEVRYRLDKLGTESPGIPGSIWNQVIKQFQNQQEDVEREIIQKA